MKRKASPMPTSVDGCHDLPETLAARPRFVETEPGVSVRLLHVPCRAQRPRGRILFVAGWMSFPDSWRMVLEALCESHEVYYLESREKNSSRVPRDARFRIQELVDDYRAVARELEVGSGKLDVVASSVGAATVIRGFGAGVRPRRIALVSPVLRPEVPRVLPLVLTVARGPLYPLVRSLASWWYGLFIYRVSRDEFQNSRFRAVLGGAEPWKVLRGAGDIFDLKIRMEEVGQVDVPALVLAASRDPQHRAEHVAAIADQLPHGRCIDLERFRRTHSRAAGRAIADFLANPLTHEASEERP